MSINDPHLLDLFASSIEKNTAVINTSLIELEKAPDNNEIINNIMRAAHNIKGAAALVAFQELRDLSHYIENVMVDINKQEIVVTPPLISALLNSIDIIKNIKNEFVDGTEITETNTIKLEIEKAKSKEKPEKEPDNKSIAKGSEGSENRNAGIEKNTNNSFHIKDSIQNLDSESRNIFIADLEEYIRLINQGLIKLEKKQDDKETINSIMRFAHNIKGSSSMIGFNRMKELMHAIETIMSQINKGEIKITPVIISKLLSTLDVAAALKDEFVQNRTDTNIADILEVVLSLDAQKKGKENKEFQLSRHNKGTKVYEKTDIKADLKLEPIQQVKFSIKLIEDMINLTRELTIMEAQLTELFNSFTVGLDSSYSSKINESTEIINFMGQSIRFIQEKFMKSKMMPVSVILRNYPRMVRDLEHSLNKKINLIIENQDTRMDQNIAEELNNPLIHIIRNSADHGIEMPEERIRIGKSETGVIKISTFQKNEQIIIMIEDDGRGIDEEAVLTSAVSIGLISKAESENLTKAQIINFIFHPGFSTSKKATDVSGRGVGMDVVKDYIKKINGTIEVMSEKGKGTKIMLRIPSTMTIIPSVIVEVNGKIFCIPAINVVKVLHISQEEINLKEKEETLINEDGTIIPVVRLQNGNEENEERQPEKLYVVVIGFAERKVGVLVDRVLKSQKIVIKPLGETLLKLKNIQGTSILEDGKIGFVLNCPRIVSDSYSEKLFGNY